jgi:hypothetical protein
MYRTHMPIPEGAHQYQPRELAEMCWNAGWHDAKHLVEAVAVCLSESNGFREAYNDNERAVTTLKRGQIVRSLRDDPAAGERLTVVNAATGKLRDASGAVIVVPLDTLFSTSRDVGLFEINIPADQAGTKREADLYVPATNIGVAFEMWSRRGWKPWYGFTGGHATSTDWWHWSEKRQAWVPTGRFMHQAVRGAANFLAGQFELKNPFLDFYEIPPKPDKAP